VSDPIDMSKLEEQFKDAMAPVYDKPTASLVVVNVAQDVDSVGTLVVDDVGTPSASKTILVGREIGTGRVCKITVEYPEEEKNNGK
jgi:hypothetical protein